MHNSKVVFLYHANDARMHAYDMSGFYHKEKHSILVCDLVRNLTCILHLKCS